MLIRVIFLSLLLMASSFVFAEIGWCGNVYPNDGTEINSTEDLTVYFQIWKEGVTDADPSARGEGLSADLMYRYAGTSEWNVVPMVYNVDVGNNDEYMGTIPASEIIADTDIEIYCLAYDSTDGSTCQGNDQMGNPATESEPLTYHPMNPIATDVTIHFSVNMNWVGAEEPVVVAGTFNDWATDEVVLSDVDSDGIYEGSFTLSAGSSRHQEYKYLNNGVWEGTGNRIIEVSDTSSDLYLPLDYWENKSTRDVYVIFRVDMSAETVDSAFIAGSQPPLHWGWDDGWTDADRIYDDGTHCDETADDGIYTTIILFPAGTYRYVEYKFTTDGTDNEPLPPFVNHTFTLTEDEDTLMLPVVIFGELGVIFSSKNFKPAKTILYQNSPNPFNSATTITFDVGKNADRVSLAIYDVNGVKICTLADDNFAKGRYSVVWDGKNDNGIDVPSGTYLLKLQVGDIEQTGKMMLIR
ncbi:T9SS type A sorting domain-containing protein [bacterium]|nr:T9SS type A sorting domain-containing protein [bacterium]